MKPLLVLAWGNRARGDDALGPLLLDALADRLPAALAARIELLEAHQLQPEHALDLIGRERVLLADADPSAPAPFSQRPLQAQRDPSLATHALSPAALLAVYEQLQGCSAPPTTLLALHARIFGLGTPPSAEALAALQPALLFVQGWVAGDSVAAS